MESDNMDEIGELIGRHVESLFELRNFVEIVHEGFGYGSHAKRLTETIHNLTTSGGSFHPLRDDDVYRERLNRDEKLEAFTREQTAKGFSYIYSLASVRLWSILEASADDAVLPVLLDLDRLPSESPIRGLKAPVLDFVRMEEGERSQILLELLKQEVRSRFRKGIGKLEVLLEAAGLGGGVHDLVRRALLELSEVRNLVVHHNARADQRIQDSCPWLRLEKNQILETNRISYGIYDNACLWYLLELQQRLHDINEEQREKLRETKSRISDTQRDFVGRIEEMWRRRTS